MKRTGETVLSIIGALFYALIGIIGGVLVWVDNNKEQVQGFFQETVEQDQTVTMNDLTSTLDVIGGSGVFLITISIAAFLAGIIAIVLLKGNKQPKVAGVILIITAVVIAFITFGGGILGGIFYLIAGIMCLARKPQTLIYK